VSVYTIAAVSDLSSATHLQCRVSVAGLDAGVAVLTLICARCSLAPVAGLAMD